MIPVNIHLSDIVWVDFRNKRVVTKDLSNEGKLRYSAFTQALADLGWTDGRNVRMDVRWAMCCGRPLV